MSFRFTPIPVLLATSFLLSSCVATPTVPVEEATRARLYLEKASRLTSISEWRLSGRLAVSNEKDGGSGNFRWNSGPGGSQMDFHGALGRGAWSLEAGNQSAEITLSDGTVHRADSVEKLVRSQVGWKIPVQSLSWWVRGLAQPGNFKARVLDNEGNLSSLQQNGWQISYDRYRDFEGLSLPTRLTARQAEWKVKLAIRSWELNTTGSTDD